MIDTETLKQKAKTRKVMTHVPDFESIVAGNEGKIFNTIYSYIGDYEDALDLTQETFICAYRHIGKFRHESSISTWLYRIAINLCKKSHSSKRRYGSVFTSSLDDPETVQQLAKRASEDESAIEVLELSEEYSMICGEIAALPRKHRAVIILKYLQDLSYEEIADVLGCSIGTVKSRLSRAKENLKQRLEKVIEVSHGEL